MSNFSLTDSLGNPVDISTVNWTSASSLCGNLKSESLHLVVAPDFIARKDEVLTQAAPQPASFNLSVGHEFQLGNTTSEVNVTPHAAAMVCVNATPGSNLFDGDSFHLPANVPAVTGYVGLSITGSLDLGVSGTSGDLTFGIDQNTSITFEYLKAFPTDQNQPTLGAATAAMFSGFVIPASIADLSRMGVNDVCSVSGSGCLTVSGGVTVAFPVNPLASVNLPLGMGTLAVQDGVMAGLSASLALTGSYQIRLEKVAAGSIRLSYLRDRDAKFETDLTASAGISVEQGTTDLLAKFLGTFEKGAVDPNLLAGLQPHEITTFSAALKSGIDHSLQASLDLALSKEDENQASFQYEIRLELLNAQSSQALARALKGDLSLLTALEEAAQADGTIAPGIKLLNSVFSTARTNGASLKINLLGIVNLISMSQLVSNCEFLYEPASGDLTIKETAESDKISAITDPAKRQDALRKALFYSVLATTTYVVGKAVTMPALNCQAVHFAVTQNTTKPTIADYTNWFAALNLITLDERAQIVSSFRGDGLSTCTLRVQFDNALCEALFFDGQGNLRSRPEYLEIGRQALKALLDPNSDDISRRRYQFLDNDATWAQAVKIGPSPELATLLPMQSMDPQFNIVLNVVSGDLYDIVWWANGMVKAGQALQQMRAYLAGRDPSSLASDPAFADHRNGLQKTMLGVVGNSKLRFQEPWGMVCLFQAAGSRGSSGKLTAGLLVIDKGAAVTSISAIGH
jgi:hypothetical protein